MTGQPVTGPAGADLVTWWQDRLDKDFPHGLLATRDAPRGEDDSPVLRVPRVEVLREEDGRPYILFVGQGWDTGTDGPMRSYEIVQTEPCLVSVATLQDGSAYRFSNGLSDRLK